VHNNLEVTMKPSYSPVRPWSPLPTGSVCRFLAIAVFFLAGLASAPAAPAQSIAIPSYAQPGSEVWNTWAAYPQAVKIMIVNLDNGDDTNFYPSVLTAVQSAQASGISVLGYTYTEYGQRDPNTVMQVIAAAETNYGLNGIFLDEAPTSCSATTPFGETNFQYYQNLSNYVHNQFNGTVVLNPGTPPATNCWMSVADILLTYENSGIKNYEQSYADMPWVYNYSASRFWNLLYAVQKQKDMQTAFSLARQRNVGLIYVTSDGGSNPWDGIPSYWAAEAALN
jgi:Spherulation-specific family 4